MEWWWQGATLYVDDVFLCGKDVGGGLVREGAVGVACLVVWGGGHAVLGFRGSGGAMGSGVGRGGTLL